MSPSPMAAVAAELELMSSRMAGTLSRAMRGGTVINRLSDSAPREVVDDIYSCALKKQTGERARSIVFRSL